MNNEWWTFAFIQEEVSNRSSFLTQEWKGVLHDSLFLNGKVDKFLDLDAGALD